MITKIGKYNIRKRLGGGGFGEVYLADDDSIGRLVAIKVFKPKDENVVSLATSATSEGLENLRQRFINEAKILASLEHEDAVVNIIEFGVLPDGAPWYSMPYLPKSLSELLGKDVFDKRALEELDTRDHPKALPLNQCLEILEQILQGLSAAHEKGLIHRDIKPANILLADNGKIRIADFGIAKAPDSGNSTVSQLGMGSRNYMAPEQRESAKHVDARADVYSLGVFAYRMLTGLLPKGRFADPNVHVPALSDDFNALILKAMQEDADDRYQDAQAMLQAFNSANIDKQNSGNTAKQSEHTGTWIGENSGQTKAELKPLEQKIIALLRNQGEVKGTDMPVLQALADLGGLSGDELTTLIQQISDQQSQSSPEQKAFQQWVQTLNQKQSTGDTLNDALIETLLEAGVASTRKSKEVFEGIVHSKVLAPQSKTSQGIVPGETTVIQDRSQKKSSSTKPVLAVIILLIIGIGGYVGHDYYQIEQARIAQEQHQQDAAEHARKAQKTKARQVAEQRALISEAQGYLIQLGYVISASGELDTRTKKAVEAFEAKRQLLVTGEVDAVLLTVLERAWQQKVDTAWQQAKRFNSSKSYAEFMTAFEGSRYQGEAQAAKTYALEVEEQVRADRAVKQADEAAWSKVSKTNTIAAYQSYLTQQVKGIYRAQAQQSIDAITEALKREAQVRAEAVAKKIFIQADDAAWSKAAAANTIESYQSYLSNNPDGNHRNSAQQVLWEINEKIDTERWKKATGDDSLTSYSSYLARCHSTYCDYKNQKMAKQIIKWHKYYLAHFKENYIDNRDGTITDKARNLIWIRCFVGQSWNGKKCMRDGIRLDQFKSAKKMASEMDFANSGKWRLPSVEELDSLIICTSGSRSDYFSNYSGGGKCKGDIIMPVLNLLAFPMMSLRDALEMTNRDKNRSNIKVMEVWTSTYFNMFSNKWGVSYYAMIDIKRGYAKKGYTDHSRNNGFILLVRDIK